MLCRELRYTQQTVAGELAGWRDMHERMGRRAIKELARGMIIFERGRLEGVRRALRRVREVDAALGIRRGSGVLEEPLESLVDGENGGRSNGLSGGDGVSDADADGDADLDTTPPGTELPATEE